MKFKAGDIIKCHGGGSAWAIWRVLKTDLVENITLGLIDSHRGGEYREQTFKYYEISYAIKVNNRYTKLGRILYK